MGKEKTIFGDAWPYSKAKSALLRSAAIVMREQGPRAATLKNIAGKAGVTEPAIFRHFDGVDGMFQSMFEVVNLFFDLFQGFYASSDHVGLDRLENALMQSMAAMMENPDFCYLITQPDPIFRQYPELRDGLNSLKAKHLDNVVGCIKEAKLHGHLAPTADVNAAAMGVLGAMNLLGHSWASDHEKVDLMKEGKRVWSGLRTLIQHPDFKPVAAKSKRVKKNA